jgi:hypothetical protein
LQNIAFFVLRAGNYLRLVLEGLVMQKAAQINNLDLGLAVPFGVAINILGDKDHVALAYAQALAEIYIRALPFENYSESRFSFVAVSAAEVVARKAVRRASKLGYV